MPRRCDHVDILINEAVIEDHVLYWWLILITQYLPALDDPALITDIHSVKKQNKKKTAVVCGRVAADLWRLHIALSCCLHCVLHVTVASIFKKFQNVGCQLFILCFLILLKPTMVLYSTMVGAGKGDNSKCGLRAWRPIRAIMVFIFQNSHGIIVFFPEFCVYNIRIYRILRLSECMMVLCLKIYFFKVQAHIFVTADETGG